MNCMKRKINIYLMIIFLIISILSISYYIEIIAQISLCVLCILERSLLMINLLILFILYEFDYKKSKICSDKYIAKIFVVSGIIISFISVFIATYHSLIESGYLLNLNFCDKLSFANNFDAEKIAELLYSENIIISSCKQNKFTIFTISLTNYNLFLNIILSLFYSLDLRKKF